MHYRPRIASLDVLRGVAVMLVLGRHITPPAPEICASIKHITAWWIQIGWTGVDLFFVLSGFLVSGLLFAEYQRHGEVDLLRFLVRRGLKIYPGFYLMIVVTVLLAVGTGAFDSSMTIALIAELLYVQNYIPGLWNHTWSLAVEEHFYILLAFGVGALLRRQRLEAPRDPFGRFLRMFVFAIVGISVGRVLAPYGSSLTGEGIDPTLLRLETHTRIDTLMIGMLLGYLYHFHRDRFAEAIRRRRWLIITASALLLMPPIVWPLGQSSWLPSIGVFSIALGFAGILSVSITATDLLMPRNAVITTCLGLLARVGFHSYSVYLWHMPVQTLLMPYLRRLLGLSRDSTDVTFVLSTTLYLVTALAVGVAAGRVIEQPFLRLRNRLFPARSDEPRRTRVIAEIAQTDSLTAS